MQRRTVPDVPYDPRPFRTADGSLTLRDATHDIWYHSLRGAVQESTHVFIKAGLERVEKEEIDVLEVGLGTGLNLLLTWIRCLEGKCRVRYTAIEPRPLDREQLLALDHCHELAWPGLQEPFLERMAQGHDSWAQEMGGLTFRMIQSTLDKFNEPKSFDVIYFDAFAPAHQPDLWSPASFSQLFAMLRPGGSLVTYCAKGNVRRAMIEAGFHVDRLPGPIGKREMLRAVRIA